MAVRNFSGHSFLDETEPRSFVALNDVYDTTSDVYDERFAFFAVKNVYLCDVVFNGWFRSAYTTVEY